MSEDLPIPLDVIDTSGATDPYNSTTTPLSNGATFTGTASDVSYYSSITVFVKTDKNGILYLDFGTNGTNWDSITSYNITADVSFDKVIVCKSRYFRIRFTNNSGQAQTYIRLQTILGSRQADISVSIDDAATETTLSSLNGKVTAVNTGNVTIASSVLPNGAATESTLSGLNKAGIVLASNSTSSPLGIGGLFTGSASEVVQFATIVISGKTDRTGLLYLDFSSDAINWDKTIEYPIIAGDTFDKKQAILARYARVRFSNTSGLVQTYLRLQTIVGQQQPDISVALDTSDLAKAGVIDSMNSSVTPLNSLATFTGTAKDVSAYNSITIFSYCDRSGSLYLDYSTDGTNWDKTNTYQVISNTPETHQVAVLSRYYRVRLTNTDLSNQTYLRLQSILSSNSLLTTKLEQDLNDDQDIILTRSVVTGTTDGGMYRNVPVTGEGHLEVALHDPLLPFGSIHVENILPVFQTDAVYGINDNQVATVTTFSGTATADDACFVIGTGTTIYSAAAIQSRKRLKYRPGQGVIARFTGLFSAPVSNSYQVIGIGHSEDGVYFGYKNLEFGILYSNRGVREARLLTITTGSSTNENITITLNGTANTVAVTNSGNIYRTAWEISQGSYSGFRTSLQGATVLFLSNDAGPRSGVYSYTATTMIGSFSQIKAGVAAIETFIPQSSWNADKLDGTGASGYTADWTKGNIFQINMQYLGFGALVFKVETITAGSNNATWTNVHIIKLPNTLITSSFRNPSFPFTMAVYSAGSTTNLTAKCASFAGFIEGQKVMHGNRYSYYNQSTSVAAASYLALFSVQNVRYYKGISNQTVINLVSICGAIKHTSPGSIYLIKNGSLVGNPNFQQYATNSCSYYDTAATTVTFSDNSQLLWSGQMSDSGGAIDHVFNTLTEEFTLQPGEWITVASRTTTGTASWVTASLNTREDQ